MDRGPNRQAVVAAIVLACSSVVSAIEVPSSVPAHSLVVAKHKPGASVWVLTVRGGMLARVENFKAPEALIFTGPPGVYTLIGTEDGNDFQEFVTIGGDPGPGPNPPPDPDPPKPDPPTPNPPDFEDTTYDVGPQVRWYLSSAKVTVSQAKKAAAAFVDASSIAGRSQVPLDLLNRRIEKALTDSGVPASAIEQYGELMGQRWDESKFRTLREHAFAWWEIAQWLDDSLKGTTPEWLQ